MLVPESSEERRKFIDGSKGEEGTQGGGGKGVMKLGLFRHGMKPDDLLKNGSSCKGRRSERDHLNGGPQCHRQVFPRNQQKGEKTFMFWKKSKTWVENGQY